MDAFLASAQAGTARKPSAAQAVVQRDSDRAIYAETRDRGGAWISRSIVATAHPAEAAGTPEAMLLGMLETGYLGAGMADARPLASLGDRDVVVLRRDASGEGWVTAIEQPESDRAFDALLAGPDGLAAALVGIAFFAMLLFLLAPLSRARATFEVSNSVVMSSTSRQWR